VGSVVDQPWGGRDLFVVLMQSEEGEGSCLGSRGVAQIPKHSRHGGKRGVWAACLPHNKSWCRWLPLGGGVPRRPARGDVERCWGTWHGSEVPRDPSLLLGLRSTWVQMPSQDDLSGVRCLPFSIFRMRKGTVWG